MLCEIALAMGLSLSGVCLPPASPVEPLPADDATAWKYQPPPPREEPKPAPAMPPVIIREIVRDAPPPPPPPPVIIEAPRPIEPDPLQLALQASYDRRSQAGIPASIEPVFKNDGEPVAVRQTSAPVPAMTGRAGGKAYGEKSLTSTQPVDNSRIVTTDRYITGILETGINTQLDGSTGGPVVIQVSRDVFGYHGRNILIPKGSRLVCGIKSLDKVGSSRAPLRCGRLLTAEHRAEIFGMKALVVDQQGQPGLSGEVDNRFTERYGTAFVLAGISAAVRAATSATTSSSSTATASGSSSTYNGGGALSDSGSELSQRLGEITAATLEQTINLTPILKVAQGTRVTIRPDTDWYISEME